MYIYLIENIWEYKINTRIYYSKFGCFLFIRSNFLYGQILRGSNKNEKIKKVKKIKF